MGAAWPSSSQERRNFLLRLRKVCEELAVGVQSGQKRGGREAPSDDVRRIMEAAHHAAIAERSPARQQCIGEVGCRLR